MQDVQSNLTFFRTTEEGYSVYVSLSVARAMGRHGVPECVALKYTAEMVSCSARPRDPGEPLPVTSNNKVVARGALLVNIGVWMDAVAKWEDFCEEKRSEDFDRVNMPLWEAVRAHEPVVRTWKIQITGREYADGMVYGCDGERCEHCERNIRNNDKHTWMAMDKRFKR